jgi:hypothetical protein
MLVAIDSPQLASGHQLTVSKVEVSSEIIVLRVGENILWCDSEPRHILTLVNTLDTSTLDTVS